jgi:hypothetical protein
MQYSWDLGTCVPSEVLGPCGIVSLNNPLLRSLSLATDSTCHHDDLGECRIDLSSLGQLQSLSWKGPEAEHLDTLSRAIERNSEQLQKLELDFVSWRRLLNSFGYFESDEEEDERQSFALFGLTRQAPRLIFPMIRELALSQVPLVAEMARAINFDTLRSLTLRMCPGSDDFLANVTELGISIRLKKLEVCGDQGSLGLSRENLEDFIGAFDGLEELFVTESGPENTLGLWKQVARHQATLKKFAHHQMTVEVDDQFSRFVRPRDLPDLGLLPQEFRRLKEDPSQSPLATLGLEFLGLCCVPERLVGLEIPRTAVRCTYANHNAKQRPILLPFTSKTCLKVLHIRRSTSDFGRYMSWALDDSRAVDVSEAADAASPLSGMSMFSSSPASSGAPSAAGEPDHVDAGRDAEGVAASANRARVLHPSLRPVFRRFVEWAFGPQGVGSLRLVVFGNLAYGGRRPQDNLIICRNTANGGSSNFQIIDWNSLEGNREVLGEYRDALRACPIEPLYQWLNA